MKTLLACLLLATPMTAQETIKMEFTNKSQRVANIAGIFTIDENGDAIDDNVGSSDQFAPGKTVTIDLGFTRCTKVEIGAWLGDAKDPRAEYVTGRTDLCTNRRMILTE